MFVRVKFLNRRGMGASDNLYEDSAVLEFKEERR